MALHRLMYTPILYSLSIRSSHEDLTKMSGLRVFELDSLFTFRVCYCLLRTGLEISGPGFDVLTSQVFVISANKVIEGIVFNFNNAVGQ